MEKLIVASKNKGKIAEVARILEGLYETVPMEEIGIDVDIDETGTTFEENALIKARYVYEQTGLAALSDDSGLVVDALGGAPGVYSARYAGSHGRDKDNNELLLKNMQGISDRRARFVSAVALVSSSGERVATGSVEGHILQTEEGNGGFGYDPLFYCDELRKSFGVASAEEKNSVSHRSRALKALVNMLGDKKKKYSIAVVSDTHGNVRALEKALPQINECDYFVYLGDGNRDIDRISDKITAQVVRVAGNCDLTTDLPEETVLKVGNTDFLVVHGHKYGVKSGKSRLGLRARELCCAYALYGHTHKADVTDVGGVMLVNPGTLSYGGGKSFAVIEGDGDFFSAEIVSLR